VVDIAEYISTEDAAEMLGYHVEHVRRMIREGDLTSAKVGRSWLVLRRSVEDYLIFNRPLNKYDPKRCPSNDNVGTVRENTSR